MAKPGVAMAAARPKIVARGLGKTFTDAETGAEVVAIGDIDCTIGEREFVSIIGPSGCGKSTFLYLVAGFEKLTSGRSEEHTSELQSLMRISYAVFCLKKTKQIKHQHQITK